MSKYIAYRAAVVCMTTELNALGIAARAISASLINNMTNLDFWADFEILLNWSSSAPSVDQNPVDLYLLPAPAATGSSDTTHTADGSSSVVPAPSLYVGSFLPHNATGAQRLILRGITLPPGYFQTLIYNGTGVALPPSGQAPTLNMYPYQTQ